MTPRTVKGQPCWSTLNILLPVPSNVCTLGPISSGLYAKRWAPCCCHACSCSVQGRAIHAGRLGVAL